MRVLLDTDTLSLFLRAHPAVSARVRAYVQEQGKLDFSLITYYEVLNGLLYRDARQQLIRFQLLLHDCRLWPLTPESVQHAARIFADLRRTGQPIGHTDTLIAGVALAQGMQLATNNMAHFERIVGLEVVNWTL